MGAWRGADERRDGLPGRARTGQGRFRPIPVVVLLLLLAVTAGVTVFAHAVVASQESKLLTERANEVTLVLNQSVSAISTDLGLLTQAYREEGAGGFTRDATTQIAAAASKQSPQALAVLQPSGGGFVVVAAAGTGLHPGQSVAAAAVAAITAAEGQQKLAATGVYRSDNTRAVGFALGASTGSRKFVVYEQLLLGPVRAPSQAGTRPFSELRVVLYASSRPDPGQVLLATTNRVPLRGQVRHVPLMVGSSVWLTAVSAIHPLVGSVAAAAWWVALAVGVVGSMLVFLLLEAMARRRDAAVEALETEHRFAETLQRRLLPTVPSLAGLDVASSYVPGADHQQVGGDWFDVFELPSGEVALVIGDVMGHDVEAAAIMAQVRASLRSYAAEGGDPSSTMERLAGFIDLFAIAAVVTVVYGVLGAPRPDGSRRFAWANAGHLPPLVRLPDGQVAELTDGASPLLGAPSNLRRPVGETLLPAGATLLLYTDGLVEVHGQHLGHAVDQLKDVFGASAPGDAHGVCAAVLATQLSRTRRDDVALLVVKVEDPGGVDGCSGSEAGAGATSGGRRL